MLRSGLVSATFKSCTAEEVVSLCKKAGLETIEWSEKWHIAEGDVARASEIRTLCESSGLEIVCYGSYYRLGLGHDFAPRIAVAAALGAPLIRIWPGDRPSTSYSSEERAALVAEAREIARMAEDNGLVVAMEWHKNTLSDTNESGLSFLEEVESPAFRTLWQPTMALSVSERAEGLAKIGSRLANIHVYYWDESGRRPLEEGRGQWEKYLSLVEGDHNCLLEFVLDDSVEQFLADARTLHSLLGR